MFRPLERIAAPRPEWLDRPERGSVPAMRLLLWLMRTLGPSAGRLLLYPVCAYFVLFAARARRASAGYLRRVLGRRATLAEVFRHYYAFASTIQDRAYFLAGNYHAFDVTLRISAETRALLGQGRGCILLGSHLGSFEVLRSRGAADGVPPVNILMYVDNAAKLNSVLGALAPDIESRVIPLGSPDALLRVHECLARGEIVGMLGDRALSNERSCRCEFLGEPARFPLGPLLLAGLLQAPVVLFFGIYRGGRRYEIHLEPFADAIALDPANREPSVQPWVERYARRLEHHCRAAPYNWFNFYDYWA